MKQLIRKIIAISGTIVLTAQNRLLAKGMLTPQTYQYRKQNDEKSPSNGIKSPSSSYRAKSRSSSYLPKSRKSRNYMHDRCKKNIYRGERNYFHDKPNC